jgi:hypothetical protein
MRKPKLAPALFALAFSLIPSLALACPYCAMRDDGSGLTTVYLLGAMILFPFGVVAVVLRFIRNGQSEAQE